MEQKVKKSRWWIWLIVVAVGIVFIIGGVILIGVLGVDRTGKTEDIYYDFAGYEISDLEIESGVCDINIVRSNGEAYIEGTGVPAGRYTARVQSNILKIEYKEKKLLDFIGIGSWKSNKIGEINIYLPEQEFDSLEFSGGVGVNKINDLTVWDLDFDGGVGENYFNNVIVLNEADFDFGVGETDMQGCEFVVSDFDIGVGEFYFKGKLTGDTNIDTGVGEVTMDIDGYREEYKINYDKGLGDVDINSGSGSPTSSSYEPESIYLDLDCGVGDVTINFK